MPRPPYLCTCGRKVAHGTICRCRMAAIRERKARHDANRPSASQRGYGSEWRKARAEYLKRHICCARPGCNAKATVVDHIKPHKNDKALFWDRANWQPLCAPCHNRHKQRQERNA